MYLKASFRDNKMKRVISIFDALRVATGAGCRAMESAQRSFQNVLPMCYPKNKNPRKLFTYKGFGFIKAVRTERLTPTDPDHERPLLTFFT